MINSINDISFYGWKQDIKFILPRKLIGYSTNTPKEKVRTYGYFMPQLREKSNPIKDFFKKMYENAKGIIEAMKPELEK